LPVEVVAGCVQHNPHDQVIQPLRIQSIIDAQRQGLRQLHELRFTELQIPTVEPSRGERHDAKDTDTAHRGCVA
jgi:hypothetical protein